MLSGEAASEGCDDRLTLADSMTVRYVAKARLDIDAGAVDARYHNIVPVFEPGLAKMNRLARADLYAFSLR